MKTIYKTKVVGLGDSARDFLDGGMMILFKKGAPPELADISVLHSPEGLKGEIVAGQLLRIGDTDFEILAVGDVVNKNIKKLGHAAVKFNDKNSAELPGDINVIIKDIPEVKKGTEILIIGK